MNKTDALVAAIGAGVLVVALAGAALTGTGGGESYAVTWSDNSALHDLDPQSIAQSGDLEFTYANPHANVTQMRVLVTASAPQGQVAPAASTFTVTVTGPNGATASADGTVPSGATGGTGETSAEVPVTPVPDVATATGATPEAALVALASAHTNTTAVGDWTILVQFTNAAVTPNYQVAFAVTVEPHWYTAAIAAPEPTTR